ncbi:unnamed protein product [Parnassius apollo]|uniref:(apollo) hypothetical protein n=1 Tax=Parnassius apollo TaxID=110799 RepID=A0A8S3W284_PARAO|nr:unnamed protein product [Parnassius apollo]
MPRVYKPRPGGKQYKKYDKTVRKQALDELTLNRHATIRSIAEKYNISRSVLLRQSNRQMRSPGGQTALTKETEDYIVLNLNTCAEWKLQYH